MSAVSASRPGEELRETLWLVAGVHDGLLSPGERETGVRVPDLVTGVTRFAAIALDLVTGVTRFAAIALDLVTGVTRFAAIALDMVTGVTRFAAIALDLATGVTRFAAIALDLVTGSVSPLLDRVPEPLRGAEASGAGGSQQSPVSESLGDGGHFPGGETGGRSDLRPRHFTLCERERQDSGLGFGDFSQSLSESGPGYRQLFP